MTRKCQPPIRDQMWRGHKRASHWGEALEFLEHWAL